MGAKYTEWLKRSWPYMSIEPVALATALLNLLNFHHYPLLRAEVGIALAGVCLMGLLMGLTQQAAGPRLSFLTLFAIRVPGEAPREVPSLHALDELMANFRNRDFSSAPASKDAPARVQVMEETRLRPLQGLGF